MRLNQFLVSGGTIALGLSALSFLGCGTSREQLFFPSATVGAADTNIFFTPTNQRLTPAGQQIELPGLRPQALALSPDGRWVVVSGKTHELVVLRAADGHILQKVALPSDKDNDPKPDAVSPQILEPDKEGQLSYSGLIFSPDGTRIYLANVSGDIKVFQMSPDGKVAGLFSIPLPPANAPERKEEIPAGLALSPDGRRLYVCGNLSNRLLELDAESGRVLRSWEVGVAPFDVVLARGKAYVSNWGGRRPDANTLTGPAGRGTKVRVDPVRHIASEGSVSVIQLATQAGLISAQVEITTGLHASGLAVSPDQGHVVVANAGSDTLSVIDTQTDQVVETIWARQRPDDLFGAQPNALAFDASGKTLHVCNGTQNAIAVIAFRPGESELRGLIPAGWFPGAIAVGKGRSQPHLFVANIKGVGENHSLRPQERTGHNTHQYRGSLSFVPRPTARELKDLTQLALHNLRYELLREARLPARTGEPARPVPERVGEPSVFKHVVYIIKENRTYDQVLGDEPRGNGDPSLCTFGERITPNQHKMVREFVLLDNTYCSGILSADGHNWSTSGIVNDYLERSFAGFPRSYPDGLGDEEVDALAYASSGFIWDNAIARGLSLRVYGEFAITDKRWRNPTGRGPITFADHWQDFTNHTEMVEITSRPAIESLRPYLCTNTVAWDMEVPDVFRAAKFIAELKQYERDGNFPNLIIMSLPNDHTSGTKPGAPTPAAAVADNDLAFGQIAEAISHSKFWKETCIFAIEDDPQNGWDHVSGYRTTCYVASPYTRRGAVVSTQYNHTSLLRTMELMLGLPPMNQLDATATPMTDCFTNAPDFTPFTVVTNNIPLAEVNPEPKRTSDALQRKNALVSARLPLDRIDACPEDTLNRIIWHAMKGSSTPYPTWAVKLVEDDDD
jgi:YVTN family beta-propeller protein